jgi:hypothetical protein
MNKLLLKLDTLSVESFPTQEAETESAGTVHGNMATRGCSGTAASCYTSCRADLRDACTCPVAEV